MLPELLCYSRSRVSIIENAVMGLLRLGAVNRGGKLSGWSRKCKTTCSVATIISDGQMAAFQESVRAAKHGMAGDFVSACVLVHSDVWHSDCI
ncbi:hypothetical protein D3C85_1624310 [compost metagenome]